MTTTESIEKKARRLAALITVEDLERLKHGEGTLRFLKHQIDEKQAREEYGLTEEEIEMFSRMRGEKGAGVFDAGAQEEIVEHLKRKTCPTCECDDKSKRLRDCTDYWHDPPLGRNEEREK